METIFYVHNLKTYGVWHVTFHIENRTQNIQQNITQTIIPHQLNVLFVILHSGARIFSGCKYIHTLPYPLYKSGTHRIIRTSFTNKRSYSCLYPYWTCFVDTHSLTGVMWLPSYFTAPIWKNILCTLYFEAFILPQLLKLSAFCVRWATLHIHSHALSYPHKTLYMSSSFSSSYTLWL